MGNQGKVPSNLIFCVTGVRHLHYSRVKQGRDKIDTLLEFVDITGKLLPDQIQIYGLQLSECDLQEDFYGGCDEVRAFDKNITGAQLEFGRIVIQFWQHGAIIGEQLADRVVIRKTTC